MNFKNFLNESKITVYHGSNQPFNKIDARYFFLDSANAQEGVGMYFGDLKTAETYGVYIKKITLNSNNFIESRKLVGVLPKPSVLKFLKKLLELDPTAMFYWVTDYGIYAEEPEDLESYMIDELYNYLKDQEIRNFQIEAAQNFSGEHVVEAWNNSFKIHGLKNTQLGFYIVINTNYKLVNYK